MTNHLNDSPIEQPEDDQYGMMPFAKALAKAFVLIKSPTGTTIALNGPWGAGKSSVVNLVRNELKNNDNDSLVISEFKCWWYRGEEALALAFLQNLNTLLTNTLQDKVKGLIPKIGRSLLEAGPVLGSAIALTPAGPLAGLASSSFNFAERFFPKGDTLEKIFNKLSEILSRQEKRFLIIIDDIDRLTPDEVIAIFRIIKSVGRLPNVMYLLVFDKKLAHDVVAEKFPSEGPHFLEKIIQASFELPTPSQFDLNQAILTTIGNICGEPDETQLRRTYNLFFDIMVPYLTTPRHVARFHNAISVSWPAVANEVNLADFLSLETIRLYEPALFEAIRFNKASLCGTRDLSGYENDPGEERFSKFLTGVDEAQHPVAKITLQRLFPRLKTMLYGAEFAAGWNAERRVCVENHFDTYFRLSLDDNTLSTRTIDDLIENVTNKAYVQEMFREAALTNRRNGKSMVPVLLDGLTTHALKIEKSSVPSLLNALFEIHDEIDLEKDKESGFAIGDTSLRFHWLIRRLTRDRFSLDERTTLYEEALRNTSLGWLVDFAGSAISDYRERESGPRREEDCLVAENVIDSLSEHALNSIRAAADNGTLLFHKDLLSILYGWRTFLGDPSEARAWTQSLMGSKKGLVILATQYTSESWSQGIGVGDLGDRVATKSVRLHLKQDSPFLDVNVFINALRELSSYPEELGDDDREVVNVFLRAWDKQNSGEDE